jgi:hypothetical protein
MSGPGRPRVLNDFKRGQVAAIVGAGCGLASAARYVGCSVDTIRREALRNDHFRQELREAEVRGQLEPLQAMRRAATTHWRAAAWLLERTNPHQFDRRRGPGCKPQELHEVVDAVIESASEEVTDPDLRDRLCRRLMVVANRAARKLLSAQRSRLDPEETFDLPTSAEQRSLDKLMADIDRSRVSALRDLKRKQQNPPKCA